LVKHQTSTRGQRDEVLAEKLQDEDGAFIYSFICVTL
jgi:hypothetical protein